MEAPLYVTTSPRVNNDKSNQNVGRQKKRIDDNWQPESAGRFGEPWGKFETPASQGECRGRPKSTD